MKASLCKNTTVSALEAASYPSYLSRCRGKQCLRGRMDTIRLQGSIKIDRLLGPFLLRGFQSSPKKGSTNTVKNWWSFSS